MTKGYWKEANPRRRSMVFDCSECGGRVYFPQVFQTKICGYKYCPHCGIRMDDKTVATIDYTRGNEEWTI